MLEIQFEIMGVNFMREFSLLDILRYYINYLWIVLIVTFLSVIGGYLYTTYQYVPIYQESTTIILGKSNELENQAISSSTITLYDSFD